MPVVARPLLRIVLVPLDAAAGMVLHRMKALAFVGGDDAVCLGMVLGLADVALLLLQPVRLMAGQRAIGHTTPEALAAHGFAAGSMAPKVEAACQFVRASGRRALRAKQARQPPVSPAESAALVAPSAPINRI